MNYRVSELEVPEDDPFKNDSLNRKPIVEFLADLTTRLNGPFVIALDSPWGSGKSTVVKMLKSTLQSKDFECIYFNSWKVDYIVDPLVALVASIGSIDLGSGKPAASFQRHYNKAKKITTAIAKRSVIAATKAATLGALEIDKDLEKIAADLAGDSAGDIVDNFKNESALLDKFRTEIQSAIQSLPNANKKTNLIFFIDELDRCRPNFAIDLLERVKHIFDIENIVFIISIDKSQLESSISAVHGAKINSSEYLRRFFDLEFGIPTPETKSYIINLISRLDLDDVFSARNSPNTIYDKQHFIDSFHLLSMVTELSLRSIERCMTRLKIVMDQTPQKSYLDPMLVSLLIVLRTTNPDLFLRLSDGRASAEEVDEYFNRIPIKYIHKDNPYWLLAHAMLVGFDKNDDRRNNLISRLVHMRDDKSSEFENRRNAGNAVTLATNIINSPRAHSGIKQIAEKIDLAARIN